MNFTYAYTPVIWPTFGTAILLSILSVYSWRRRSMPGARPFAFACLFSLLMALSIIVTYLAVEPQAKIFWFRFGSIWWLPATTAITCFILEYAWPGRWLTRRNLLLLSIAPLLGALLTISNGWLHLLASNYTIQQSVTVEYGRVGQALVLYTLAFTILNLFVFIWLFIHSPQHRLPVALMAITQMVIRILFVTKTPELDALLFNIPEFSFSFIAYAIALFGFHLFDPVPMARQQAIQQLHSGMLVIDWAGRVVSLNPAAERILQAGAGRAKGRRIHDLLPACPPAALTQPGPLEQEISLDSGAGGGGAQQRTYLLAVSPLTDWRGLEVGRLLLLNDITEQKQAQAQIIEQQRVLATLTERERMARELHDSIGQVLGYAGLQIDSVLKLSRERQYAQAEDQLVRLASVIRDTHADVREYILNLRSAPSLQRPFFSVVSDYLDGFAANYNIHTSLAVDSALHAQTFSPDVQLQVFRILQEALSNARKHGQARQVQVSFAAEDGRVRMCVRDDGRGFAPENGKPDGSAHFGLQFMRERAESLGGCLRIDSAPGAGTCVALDVPRSPSHQ